MGHKNRSHRLHQLGKKKTLPFTCTIDKKILALPYKLVQQPRLVSNSILILLLHGLSKQLRGVTST